MTQPNHQLPDIQKENKSWFSPLTSIFGSLNQNQNLENPSLDINNNNNNNSFNFGPESGSKEQTFPINSPFYRPSINPNTSNGNGTDNIPTINCFPLIPLRTKRDNISKNQAQNFERWKRQLENEYLEETTENCQKRIKNVHKILSDSLNSNTSNGSNSVDNSASTSSNNLWMNGHETNRKSLNSSRFLENSWSNPLGWNDAVENDLSFRIWNRNVCNNTCACMSNMGRDMSNPGSSDKYFYDSADDDAARSSSMFILPEKVGSWRLNDPDFAENSPFFPRPFTAPSTFLDSNFKVSRQNNGQCQSHDVFSSTDPKFPNSESIKSSKFPFSDSILTSSTAGTGNNRNNIGPPKTNAGKPESVGIEKEKFLDMQRRAELIQVSLSGKGLGARTYDRNHRLGRNQSQVDVYNHYTSREIGNQSWNQNNIFQNQILDKRNELEFNLFPINPGKSRVAQSKSEYFCCPPVSQLDTRTIDGQCYVKNFEVGHIEYGSIIFDGIVDVFGLNLDKIVEFQSKTVTLYPHGSSPPYGRGLNRKALVMLTNVFPENRRNLQFNYDYDGYEEFLKQACSKFGGSFLEYNRGKGLWTFWVWYSKSLKKS